MSKYRTGNILTVLSPRCESGLHLAVSKIFPFFSVCFSFSSFANDGMPGMFE